MAITLVVQPKGISHQIQHDEILMHHSENSLMLQNQPRSTN